MADGGGCIGGGPQPKMRGGFQVQVFTLKEVEKATNNFSESNMMGKGVYRGVLTNGTAAVIKILRANGRSAERAFRSEVPSSLPLPLYESSYCHSKIYFKV